VLQFFVHMKMRRLNVSLTDAQLQFVVMHRRGSMPAYVRHLINEAIARDLKRMEPQLRQFGVMEKVLA
jgi:hypothetical protein